MPRISHKYVLHCINPPCISKIRFKAQQQWLRFLFFKVLHSWYVLVRVKVWDEIKYSVEPCQRQEDILFLSLVLILWASSGDLMRLVQPFLVRRYALSSRGKCIDVWSQRVSFKCNLDSNIARRTRGNVRRYSLNAYMQEQ